MNTRNDQEPARFSAAIARAAIQRRLERESPETPLLLGVVQLGADGHGVVADVPITLALLSALLTACDDDGRLEAQGYQILRIGEPDRDALGRGPSDDIERIRDLEGL
jgi:hypothetical protein